MRETTCERGREIGQLQLPPLLLLLLLPAAVPAQLEHLNEDDSNRACIFNRGAQWGRQRAREARGVA